MLCTSAEVDLIDSRTLRDALGAFPTGVSIVTTMARDGCPVGLTCNSLSSVSLSPPLISWCLRADSRSLPEFQSAQAFTVHILADDQHHIATRFSSSKVANKFEGVAWQPGSKGIPLISDCIVSLECTTFAAYETGDHWLFIGRVHRVNHARNDESLVFFRGAYMQLARSLRQLVTEGNIDPAGLAEARRLLNCMLLQLACEHATPEDHAKIAHSIDEIDGFSGQEVIQQRAEASVAFFRAIAAASHNDVLMIVSDTLINLVRYVLKADANLVPNPHLNSIRRQILQSLVARDKRQAQHWMNQYFEANHQPWITA